MQIEGGAPGGSGIRTSQSVGGSGMFRGVRIRPGLDHSGFRDSCSRPIPTPESKLPTLDAGMVSTHIMSLIVSYCQVSPSGFGIWLNIRLMLDVMLNIISYMEHTAVFKMAP